jgi:hypothetical protein
MPVFAPPKKKRYSVFDDQAVTKAAAEAVGIVALGSSRTSPPSGGLGVPVGDLEFTTMPHKSFARETEAQRRRRTKLLQFQQEQAEMGLNRVLFGTLLEEEEEEEQERERERESERGIDSSVASEWVCHTHHSSV